MPSFFVLPSLVRYALVVGVLGAGLRVDAAALEWTAAPVRFTAEDYSQAEVRFTLRNASDAPLTITAAEPSCGCTVVETPPQPWILAPQDGGMLVARVDLRGKRGELHKTIRLTTSAGGVSLPVKIDIPFPTMSASRLRNQLVALTDARAIFVNDCARCHAQPATGKSGAALFQAICAICHEAHPRAESVPDLKESAGSKSADYLRTWITEGKPGSLMPPFAREKGGILDNAQIQSLVEFLRDRDQPSSAP